MYIPDRLQLAEKQRTNVVIYTIAKSEVSNKGNREAAKNMRL